MLEGTHNSYSAPPHYIKPRGASSFYAPYLHSSLDSEVDLHASYLENAILVTNHYSRLHPVKMLYYKKK